MPMGAFGNSLKRELGKNTGKFISNVVFGDMHSTPYRRVDSRRQAAMNARLAEAEARRRVEEVKKEARLEEARLKREEARERAELDRKNQLYAIELKANKWERGNDEAAIRNKYTDALLEKYVLCVQELELTDPSEPHLKYYKSVATKAKRSRFFKKNGSWLYPLIIILTLLAITFVIAVLSIMPDLFLLSIVFVAEYYTQIVLLCVLSMAGLVGYKLFIKKSRKKKDNGSKTIQSEQKKDESEKQKDTQTDSTNENESIFFDLNEDERLFVGVNPSYNPIDDEVFISSADRQSLMYGSFYQRDDAPDYFKSLEEFASFVGKGYTHINLLYARENDRDALLNSNSDFIREQLELTYDTIVKIAPLAIFFFSDYCREMIFGADRWVDPATEQDGHYILRGTNIPIFFTDDITIIDDASRMALIRKLKTII